MRSTQANQNSDESNQIPSHAYYNLLIQFLQAANEDIVLYARKKIMLFFPKVSKSTVVDLCQEAEALFRTEPSLLDLQSPCLIIGDLHGHVLDLYRILKYFGIPHNDQMNPRFKTNMITDEMFRFKRTFNTKYIFLGDLIDRGEFSVETITIVFLLKVLFPNHVYIIRGNHEFDYLGKQCGFLQQVSNIFNDYNSLSRSQNIFTDNLMKLKKDSPGSEVYNAFMNSFSFLPFGIRIDGKMLCVHGGIGPEVINADIISSIKRPVNEFGVNGIVDSLLWSDPKTNDNKNTQKGLMPKNVDRDVNFSEPIVEQLRSVTHKNDPNPQTVPSTNQTSEDTSSTEITFVPSNRGCGFLFGSGVLDDFLRASKLEVLVRAHECVIDGCEEVFNGHLITVFSASNYCGFVRNYSAVFSVKPVSENKPEKTIFERCEVFRFYPLEYLKRPTPVTININGNLETFSDNNNSNCTSNTSSSRVIELSGYYKRYSSDVTRKTPLSQLLTTPLNTARGSHAKTELDEATSNSLNIPQAVSIHDPHKLAGLKSTRPNFVRHDATMFRQGNLLNKLKRNQTHQVELPAFMLPKPSTQAGGDSAVLIQGAGQLSSRRITPSEIAAVSKLKNRTSSEFKS